MWTWGKAASRQGVSARQVRPKFVGDLDGDPNQLGQTLAVFSTAGVHVDALQQRHCLFGALNIDCVAASEQFKAFEHRTPLPQYREAIIGVRLEGMG
jgi:hypothetical protein